MSRDRMMLRALRDSQASKRNEKMIQPVKIHLPMLNGICTVFESDTDSCERILPAHRLEANMAIAVYKSDT